MRFYLIAIVLMVFTACRSKQSPVHTSNVVDLEKMRLQLKKIYEQTHNDRQLRIALFDSFATVCGQKQQTLLQMEAYSLICNEFQFNKNVPGIDSFAQKATDAAVKTQDSAVLATYHLMMGKNYYSTSRSQDSALVHMLKATAFAFNLDDDTYIRSTMSLGLIAQESGDYTTALDFIDQAIEGKKNAGNDPLLLANYYMIAATLASSKIDTAATYSYYNAAKKIITANQFDKVHYQAFVEARLAMFEKRYKDALAAYNESTTEFNLLVYTDKIKLFEQIGQKDSVNKTIALLDRFRDNIYKDKDVLKEYLPLKIKYSSSSDRGFYVEEYTTLMKKMLVENKAVAIQKNLQEIERVNVEIRNEQEMARQEKHTTIALFSTVVVGLAGLIAFLIIASKRRKLEYALLQSQYETSKTERNRIAQELHDDLGANFTSINLAADLIEKKHPDAKPKELDIILTNAQKIFDKLKEIVWSMNAGNDSLGNLILFVKRFIDSFLEQTNVAYKIVDNTTDQHNRFMDAFTRRRLFLAIKEMLNNTIKYANASLATVLFEIKANELRIVVTDDGKGFDVEKIQRGNGVFNIQRIIEDIPNSIVNVSSNAQGTIYEISIVLK